MSISINQHLSVFVSSYVAPVGGSLPTADPVTTIDDAGFLAGMITFMATVDGACTAAPPVTEYQAAFKDANGVVHLGEKLDPTLSAYKASSAAFAAAVQKVQTLTPLTFTAGDQYNVKVRVPGYGGLIGAEDEVYFYGTYTVESGDGASEVCDGIRLTLGKALAKCPVPIIALSGTTTLILTGVAQPYTQSLFSGRLVSFYASFISPEAEWIAAADTTPSVFGSGNYNQVAKREEFYAGYNTFYKNRQADWPGVTQPTLAAVPAGQYDALIYTQKTPYGDANLGSQRVIHESYFDTAGTSLPV